MEIGHLILQHAELPRHQPGADQAQDDDHRDERPQPRITHRDGFRQFGRASHGRCRRRSLRRDRGLTRVTAARQVPHQIVNRLAAIVACRLAEAVAQRGTIGLAHRRIARGRIGFADEIAERQRVARPVRRGIAGGRLGRGLGIRYRFEAGLRMQHRFRRVAAILARLGRVADVIVDHESNPSRLTLAIADNRLSG
jgi:hypothetical protein